MDSPKRILVVDDERPVLFVLKKSLAKLGDGYEIQTARSGGEALAKMGQTPFDLVVTDLRMPGMDGLELMKRIREQYANTRLILMTAYGNAEVEKTAYRLGACRYIDKPFEIDDLLAEARSALAKPEAPGRNILVLADEQFDAIAQCLTDLRFEIRAEYILLADVAGQMVASVGETEGLNLAPLISLVGGSFATSFEMARYLGENHALTLNYHEGERYDVYSSNVNEDLFIVLLFDKRRQQSRLGMVWLYTRRALKRLQGLVSSAEQVKADQVLDADFGALLSNSLDQAFTPGGEVQREAPPPSPATAVPAFADSEPQARPKAARPLSPSPTQVPDATPAPDDAETFSFQQALEMGLLDPSWIDDADAES